MTINNHLIEQFTTYLQELGYSRGSVYLLPHCIERLSEHQHPPLHQLTTDHLRAFYHWLKKCPNKRQGGGLSGYYINHHLYAMKMFYNWMERTGRLTTNPASTLDLPRLTGESRQPLSRMAISRLFASCEEVMETALLHVYYSCGLRRSEGMRLNTTDVVEGLLYVRKGKGVKRRVVPLPPKVSSALSAARRFPRNYGESALLINKQGDRMSGWSANRLLQQLCERAGINEKVSLHHLRHSIATHLLESGLAVEQVRDFLGHACLETTQHYTKVERSETNKLTN